MSVETTMGYNYSVRGIVIALLVLVSRSNSNAQRSCSSSDSKKVVLSEETIFIENFSAVKCMRVEALGVKPDANVVLDECLFKSKSNGAQDQQFQIVSNAMNKTMIKNDAGRGDRYCLVLGNDFLRNTLCNGNNMDQSWTLKPIRNQPSHFLIEQFSSKKCLKPASRATRSKIQLAPCNSNETEQIWKIYLKPTTGKDGKAVQLISCGEVLRVGSSVSSSL